MFVLMEESSLLYQGGKGGVRLLYREIFRMNRKVRYYLEIRELVRLMVPLVNVSIGHH